MLPNKMGRTYYCTGPLAGKPIEIGWYHPRESKLHPLKTVYTNRDGFQVGECVSPNCGAAFDWPVS